MELIDTPTDYRRWSKHFIHHYPQSLCDPEAKTMDFTWNFILKYGMFLIKVL